MYLRMRPSRHYVIYKYVHLQLAINLNNIHIDRFHDCC